MPMRTELDFHILAYLARHGDGYAYGCQIWLKEVLGGDLKEITYVRRHLKALHDQGLLHTRTGDPEDRLAGQPRQYYRLNESGSEEFRAVQRRLLAVLTVFSENGVATVSNTEEDNDAI